jgi:hypothetical protein
VGFRIITTPESISIDINSLTPQMLSDLITCFAYDIVPEDVECRYLIKERVGLEMNYPIIDKSVISKFYELLDELADCIRDIIIGNYHTGSKVVVINPVDNQWYYINSSGEFNGLATQDDINAWVWGKPIDSINDNINTLEYWVNFVVKRDFYEEGTWMFTYSQGDFSSITPFINNCVYLFINANDNGTFKDAIINIQQQFPFIQE